MEPQYHQGAGCCRENQKNDKSLFKLSAQRQSRKGITKSYCTSSISPSHAGKTPSGSSVLRVS